MIDADALAGRRAWLACVRCDDGAACAHCRDSRTCEEHWRYLLSAEGRRLFVQCPECRHRWWHDTGFGSGDRTERTAPPWPSRGRAA
ncbi:hypothetical protein [Pseudonocardia sp.]|uniref:hypothetical protein n=1 Tax=Pseudonocardia sp. TaxID=60912 RepID=UPI003D0F1691